MKKKSFILNDTSGETIVEVVVAFTLLSIMLVIFSQGITAASKAEINAAESRNRADQAMIALQRKLASADSEEKDENFDFYWGITWNRDDIRRDIYTYNDSGYTYVVYKAITS